MRLSVMLAAALCAAAPARAQESGGVDFFQSSLREILDTPMLAASYAEERPSDAAAAAAVITGDTIRKRGYGTLLDLLSDMPQFQVQRNSDVRRLNLLTVRGISNNERLVILYDGVRVTPPTGDILALAGQFSLRNAERVEVVLGPMSSVYGADAFSGVVNVVSRPAGKSEASAQYGRFKTGVSGATATSEPQVAGSGIPSGAVTYETRSSANPELSAFYKDDYSWFNNQYKSGLAQTSVFNSATVSVPVSGYDAHEDSSFLNARLNVRNLQLGAIKMKESHSSSIGVKPELTLYSGDARFATEYWTVYGRHSYTSPDETWKLNSLLSYYDYEISPETRFINSFSGYEDAYKYARAQTATIEEVLSFEAAEGYPALLGFTYQQSAVLPYTSDLGHKFDTDKSPLSQNYTYSGTTIPIDFHSLNYSNAGAFLRLQSRELGHAVFSLGLRYDRNTAYGETWNPRAGVVWKHRGEDQTVVKALYGEAYLAPSPFYTHKHFGSLAGYSSMFFHIPNENLKPEKLRSAELSISRGFGHSLRVTVNPYYNIVRDLIQDVVTGAGFFHGVPVASVEQAQNRGTLESHGATLRADSVLRAGRWNFEPWAAYTYSEGHLAGGPLPFNSRHVIQAGLSVERGRWSLSPKVLYRSYTRNQDGGRVPQFTTADLFARYRASPAMDGGLEAWAGLKNIFDRRYYNAAYGGGADRLDGGAPQTPFEASLGLGYRF